MSVGPARTAILIGLIVAGTLLAYAPAMRAGFLWDDDDHVTENVALRSLGGLARIWLEPGATPQYYPLVHTSFWIEYHLWGTSPLGYHLVNVLLHVTVALLFGLALSRLSVPGAWWAAAFFALHPVHVETVAWITERKNLLSALFYLLALLAWLRGHPIGENKPLAGGGTASSSAHPGSWILAFVFFLASLLTKTVTASFPVAILLLHWWKEGRIGRRLLASLAPFFVAGFLLGLQTVSIERRIVGAQGEEWNLSPLARTAIAGRALWFYLAKLIAPVRLSFIYPRWDVESLRWIATLAPLAFAATIAALWFLRRRIGRGPLVACLFFAGTLFPALGFFDVYPFRYSFVADHFQYHASLGAIAFAAAALTLLARRLPRPPRAALRAAGLALLLLFAAATRERATAFLTAESLWEDTIAKSPRCWMAHHNLGMLLEAQGRIDDAVRHYERALAIRGDLAQTRYNLAVIRARRNDLARAGADFEAVIEAKPGYADAHVGLANVLFAEGRIEEAIERYQRAVALDPLSLPAHKNLALAYESCGRPEEAAREYGIVLRLAATDRDAASRLSRLRQRFPEGDLGR